MTNQESTVLTLPPDSFPAPGADADADAVLDALLISDIHLGSDNCQAKPLAQLLDQLLAGEIKARRLIINGDMFDSIDFRRLKKTHWKILSLIRHLSDKLQVVWIAGNHDGAAEIVSHLLGVEVVEQFVFASGEKKILVVHGHIFDDFIEEYPLVTWCADQVYYILQRLDKTHRVARAAKRHSKVFVRCIEKIERGAMELARRKGCHVAVCGHTHHATHVRAWDVEYFNSGCWTETPSTYLTFDAGRIEIRAHATTLSA